MAQKFTFSLSRKGFTAGPTPAHIARRIDIWAAILGVLITGINSTPFPVSAVIASTISWFFGLVIACLLAIKPFYSVTTTQKNVPIDQVETIETEPEKKDK